MQLCLVQEVKGIVEGGMCTHDNMEVRQQHSMRRCYNDPKVAINVHEHHEHIVHLKIMPLACLVHPSFPCHPALSKLDEHGNFGHGVVNCDNGWYALHSQCELLLGLLVIEPLLTFGLVIFFEWMQGTH